MGNRPLFAYNATVGANTANNNFSLVIDRPGTANLAAANAQLIVVANGINGTAISSIISYSTYRLAPAIAFTGNPQGVEFPHSLRIWINNGLDYKNPVNNTLYSEIQRAGIENAVGSNFDNSSPYDYYDTAYYDNYCYEIPFSEGELLLPPSYRLYLSYGGNVNQSYSYTCYGADL